MADLRRRRFATAVWVPLRASETIDPQGKYGRPQSREELFCAGSIAFPPASRAQAEKLGWSDLGLIHSGGPYAFKDKPYKPAEVYQYRDGEDLGIEFIFEQSVSGHPAIWHVNPDVILALSSTTHTRGGTKIFRVEGSFGEKNGSSRLTEASG